VNGWRPSITPRSTRSARRAADLLRVLEISDVEAAAAYCGKLFRRGGAEVIRVESPGRELPEVAADIYLNGGKLRRLLDADDPVQREELEKIARSCDVLVTDRSVADIERLDLLDLSGAAPVVRLAITPFGLTGPYAGAPATDASLLALGGYSYIIGDPDKAPLTFVGRYASYQGGTLGYAAALATHRSRRGVADPVRIDVSVLECLASLHQSTYTKWLERGEPRSRAGNRMDGAANSLQPTADGWVGVSQQQQFWFSLATMIGRPDIAEEGHPLSTTAGRLQHYDEFVAVIREAFREQTSQEVFDEAQATWRLPIGKLVGVLEALDDPHLNEREFWRPLADAPPEWEALRVPGSSARVIGVPAPAEHVPQPVEGDSTTPLDRPGALRQVLDERTSVVPSVSRPLEGVRILDLTRVWAGPMTGRFLSDLGADTIKIEAPSNRGPREVAPGTRGYVLNEATKSMPWNGQAVFTQLQRNRRGVCVDLKTEEGKALFLKLVRESDVVLENFSARAMTRLGLGYDVLSEVNPRIIYAPMPAFGRSGPYRDFVGFGTSVEPLAAIPSILGYPGSHPHTAAIAIPDPMAGTTAAAAVIEALARRDETGSGCELDISQHEGAIAFVGEYFIEAQLSGRDPERVGNEDPRYAPHNTYPALGDDDWIAVAARNDDEWQALNRVASQGWEQDPRFATADSRLQHRSELDEAVGTWTASHDKLELMRSLMDAAVPAGAILRGPELIADPQLAHRGYFAELRHPVTGSQNFDGSPFVFDGERGYDHWRPTPMLGEHNHEVLEEVLSLDTSEVDRLTAAGVLRTEPPE